MVIDSDKVILSKATVSKTQIDLTRSTTSIPNSSIEIIDHDESFTVIINDDDKYLIGTEIKIWDGRVDVEMPFSEYILRNIYKVKNINYSYGKYGVKASSNLDLLQRPLFDKLGNLQSAITDIQTTISFESASAFESSGFVIIESEYIEYTGNTYASSVNTITGCSRGVITSEAKEYDIGTQVFEAYHMVDNPIDIILKMLISGGGGGVYDVLPDGLGIDENLIDITSIESLRDTYFSGETFEFYLSNIENTLKWFENNLLQQCNIRIVENTINGLINLVILDQLDFTQDLESLGGDNILSKSEKWSNTENGVYNEITIIWDYNEGQNNFRKTSVFEDADSITRFGKKPLKIEFNGVKSALAGAGIIANRAIRYLQRFKNPRPTIGLKAMMSTSLNKVGDKIFYNSTKIPGYGKATLGFNGIVEIVNRAVNYNTGTITYSLKFMSSSDLRIGLIGPSPKLQSSLYISQTQIEVSDPSLFEVGDKCLLWDTTIPGYATDPINTISDITGSILTFDNSWSTSLNSDDLYLKMADYADIIEEQSNRWAFVCYNTGEFLDGSKDYQIIL